MMKLKFLAAIFVTVMLLPSCLGESGSNTTPYIQLDAYPVTSSGDTLDIIVAADRTTWLMDTVSAGDTVNFEMLLIGFDNNLTELNLQTSSDSVAKILLPPVDSLNNVFALNSDYANGNFLFEKKLKVLQFPFRYVALKPSKVAVIYITLTSDAKFDIPGANATARTIKTPIKE